MSGEDGVLLALNSGSSSLKIACYKRVGGSERAVLQGSASGIGAASGALRLAAEDGTVLLHEDHLCESQEEALARLAAALREHLPSPLLAVGHRVVHGGPQLRVHQRITPALLQTLEAAVHLAPLHIPQALRLIRKTEELFGNTPQFACFDTTFHRHMPDVATHLPLPDRFFAAGVQRYGFHGLSCESVMRRLGAPPPRRLVIAHLGSGSSVTAVLEGRSTDTSMGLSPTGGLPMGTRSGDLDPAVVLTLLRQTPAGADGVESLLNHQSGLAGLSGGEADMEHILQRAGAGDGAAALARDAFCTAVRKSIGAYAALLGGLDQVVFTGGIGQHSEEVRRRVMDGLDFLFASSTAATPVLVLEAQEEAEIATHCRDLLGTGDSPPDASASLPGGDLNPRSGTVL